MAVSKFYFKQLIRIHAKILADHHPYYTTVGDDQAGLFQVLPQLLKKRRNPFIEVIKAFSPRGSKGFNLFSPFLKHLRHGLFDMVKGFAVPGSQIYFIEPGIDLVFFPGTDDVFRVPASQKTGGVNFFKLQMLKGFFPEQGLFPACFIQGNICPAHEPFGSMSLYLPVAKQVYPWLVIGELYGWIGLQPLRSWPEFVE